MIYLYQLKNLLLNKVKQKIVMEKKNLHTGHRKRLRQRAIDNNLEDFEEHQVLELLLTFVIPQKDTNPLAHELINEFGSLAGVLNASSHDLMSIKGISEYSADFLTLLKYFFKKFRQSKLKNLKKITNTKQSVELCVAELADLPVENVFVACIDNSNNLVTKKIISTGFNNEATVPVRKIIDMCIRTRTSNIIIAHNHPNGNHEPSGSDDNVVKSLALTLSLSGIKILDSVIIGIDGYYSYKLSNKLEGYYAEICENNKDLFKENHITLN